MKNRRYPSMHLFCTLFLFLSLCAPPRNNPLDPDNPDYEDPGIVLVTEASGPDTFFTDTVSITWTGNQPGSQFNFRLDSSVWSGWSTGNTLLNRLCDDGNHLLEIQVRYPEGAYISTDTVGFYVDALRKPAVFLSPRQQTITGTSATIVLKTKGLDKTYLFHCSISGASISDVDFIFGKKDAGISGFNSASTIDIIVLPGGSPIEGTCDLAEITVTGITSTGVIECTNVAVRDSANYEIDVEMVRSALVNW